MHAAPPQESRLMDNIEAIIVRADLGGNLSEGAQAAVRDLAKLEDAARKITTTTAQIGEGAQRASQGFTALEARLDSNVRLTNAKVVADARLAREIETITRSTEAGTAAQARANALIEAATRNRDAYIAKVRQDVALSEQRTARLLGETAAMGRLDQASATAGNSAGRLGQVMGQAGFQIQDFAVQVQGGTSALVALSQQGSQMLGVFGTGGAIAGAVLTVGLLAAQLLGTRAATDELKEALDGQKLAMDQANDAADRYTSRLEDQAEALVRLGTHYRNASEAARAFDTARLTQVQGNLTTQRNAIDNRLFGGIDSNVEAGRGVQQQFDAMGNATGFLTEATRRLTPGLEQARQALAEFRSEAVVTSDGIAALYNRFTTLDAGSAAMNTRLREAAAGLLAAAPDLLRIADAQREAAVQFLAVREAAGASGEELDRYAARFGNLAVQVRLAGASLNSLRQGAIGGAEDRVAVEIQRNEAILRAVQSGGRAAGLAMQEAGTRQEQILRRASELEEARQRQMVAAGRTAEEARESVRELRTEFVAQATAAVDGGRAVTRALEAPAAAARSAARTVAEADEEIAAASRAVIDAERARQSLMSDGASVHQAIRTESEKYADELARLNNLLNAGAIEQETYNRAVAAADPAMRAAREAARQVEQDNKTTTDSIVRYGADRFADMFGDNKKSWAEMWSSFLSTSRATMARIAAEAIIRPVITPIVSSLGLGALGSSNGSGLGSLLGLGGIHGGASGVSTAGSTAAGLQQAQQSAGLFSAGRFGNLGNAFTSSGAANTGFGWLDGALNTQLVAPSGVGGILPAGVQGPLAPASNGLTVAGGIGGAASIGLGAYSIYSGIQRGGPGGYTSALGGAAGVAGGALSLAGGAGLIGPGLAALGPYGMAAAAILAIAGALLPGQKASGKGQEAFVNVDSGSSGFAGLGGDRYSQENRDAAGNAANQVAALARQVGEKLGGAQFGSHVAVGVTSGRGNGPGDLYLDVAGRKAQFSNDEAGSKQLAEEAGRLILRQFREANRASGDYAGILNASGDSLETLQKNLDWYEQTYKVLAGTAPKLNEFADGLRGVVAPFDEVIGRAREYGLQVGAIEDKRSKALEEAIAPMLAPLKSVSTAQTEYEKGLENIRENYEATIRVVGELGRGTDDLREAMAKAEVQFKASANAAFQSRVDEVSGNGFLNQIRAAQAEYDANAANAASMGRNYSEITHLAIKNILDGLNAAQLRLVAGSDFGAHRGTNDLALAMLPAVEAVERAAAGAEAAAAAQEEAARAQQQAAERLQAVLQAGGGVRAYLDGQRGTSTPGGAIPQQALAESQAQFARDLALSRGGDLDALGRVTGTADRVLAAGQDMFASSPEFQALRSMVLSSLESLPATRSYDQMTLDTLQLIASGQMRATELLGILSADTDRDQRISWPEFASFSTSQAEAFSSLAQALGATGATTTELFRQIDADNDGILSRLEIQNALASTAVDSGQSTVQSVLRLGSATDIGNQLQSGSNQWLAALTGILDTLRYSAEAHLPYLTRLPDIQTSIFLLKELARGHAGGVRVTTLRASGGADGGFQQYGAPVGNPFGHDNFGGLEAGGIVGRYAAGGVVGNGRWNEDSVLASYAGGGSIALAGGEFVMPAPRTQQYEDALWSMRAGTFGANGSSSSDAVARMVERLAREIVELRAEMQRMVRAGERTADATEETASSNAAMARREVIVGRRSAA